MQWNLADGSILDEMERYDQRKDPRHTLDEAIASSLEAVAFRWEAVATRGRLRLVLLLGWRPSL